MTWMCVEVRDRNALDQLMRVVREQTALARAAGGHDEEARVYVAPYKASHRVYFNLAAHAALPVLRNLAHAPCEEPQEHERREPVCA